MKCTQCGCKKLIKIDVPFYTIDGRVQSPAIAYTCYECGHLELFDKSVSSDYKDNVMDLKKSTIELNDLKKKLLEMDNPLVLNLLKDDCKTIEKELTNLDITLRQQQELKSKLCDLQLKINNYPQDVKNLKRKISELEMHIEDLKKKISNTAIIVEE